MIKYLLPLLTVIALSSCEKEELLDDDFGLSKYLEVPEETKEVNPEKEQEEVTDKEEVIQFVDFGSRVKRVKIRKRRTGEGFNVIVSQQGADNFTEVVAQIEIRIDGYDENSSIIASPLLKNGYDPKGVNHNGYAFAGLRRNGYTPTGVPHRGYGFSGLKRNGYTPNGVSHHGYGFAGLKGKLTLTPGTTYTATIVLLDAKGNVIQKQESIVVKVVANSENKG